MVWIVNVIFLAGLLVSLWFIATRRANRKLVDQNPAFGSSTHPAGAAPAAA